MTIIKPEKNFLDKILKWFGKERLMIVSSDLYEKFGPYVYAKGRWESFWKCLFRRSSKKEGYDDK